MDLLTSTTEFPPFEEFVSVVRKQMQPIAETLGLGQLDFRKYNESNDFERCWVVTSEKPLFSIDLTKIGGSVLESQVIKQIIAGASDRTERTATANYLLLQKCEVFLARRHVKPRDAFDIHLLLGRGASLNDNLQSHLEDFVLLKDLDTEFIEARIQSIDVKLCTTDLRSVLPPALFNELITKRFAPIADSLRKVFSKWLEGN